jgi:hypothetical protein
MSDDGSETLDKLSSLLEAARAITRQMLDDTLSNRLLEAFTRMPEGDREVIVGAIEREVRTRLLSQDVADDLTQIALRPNPNARLYLRVVEPADRSDDVEMMAFMRAAYSVQRGIDALDPQWRAMVVMALRSMDPEARATIDRFNATIRDLLDDAARLGPVDAPIPPTETQPPTDTANPPPRATKDVSSKAK